MRADTHVPSESRPGGGRHWITSIAGAMALILLVPVAIFILMHALGLGAWSWLAGGVGWALILGLVYSRGWFSSREE